jgi:hypothetical protein
MEAESVYYAEVTSAKIKDEYVEMSGYYYNSDDEDDRNGTFVATAKPHDNPNFQF